ncbi:tetratricopeptide repeat protein [Streptomyces sp. ISL-36]|uniref:tetratricopeptide repeat protein n=1 Tax=Streptomyces sp. ISL-36 TaxID=2819182 RepID=UPI001BE734A8|nr:tetratricopeptide repeat protein [Streptomyces sp. ISL-36]MBT2440092.1 tetratricopeptide repeat protein [Streptomyces sp. ISL-36]
MDAPVGPRDGVVYTQIITATGGGRVNAVQQGDQYNYIYRGTPPYQVEPFPLTVPAAVPAGLARVPSRLLMARHQVVPFLSRPELALLETWRDGESPGLSVRLVHAEGGSGKTRLAAEFAARSARAGWAVALARHRSEVASAGGGDQSLAVRAPGLVMIVDYAERWPLEDLITLVRQHRDAARDRLRILLLARPAGIWWQGLAHQFTKLDILDVDALRLEGIPDTPGARAGMYVAARDRFAEIFAHTHPARIGIPGNLHDPVFALTLTVHMRALVDVDAASRGKTPPPGSSQASLSSYLLDRERDHWRSFHDQGRGPLQTTEQTMGRAVYVATLTGALSPADATAALTRTGAADTPAAGRQLVEDHTYCYPPTGPGLVLDPLAPDRLGEDYLALSLPGHEEEFGYHATDPWTITTPTALLAPDHQDSRPAPYTRQALTVMIEAAHRWPHLTTQHLDPLLRRHPTLALAAGGAALARLTDLPTLDITVLGAVNSHFPKDRHTDLDAGIAAITARLVHHHLPTLHDPASRAHILQYLATRQLHAGLRNEAITSGRQALQVWRDLTSTDPAREPELANSLTNLGVFLSEVGRQEEALTAAQEAVEIRRRLTAGNPAAHEPDLALSLTNLGASLWKAGRGKEALTATQKAVEIRRRLATDNPAAHEPSLADLLTNLGIFLSEVGRGEEALTAAQEAVKIQRRLATDNPAVHGPDLAGALSNLGNHLSWVGRREEALTATQEAVKIQRRLATDNPAAHEPDLALSLNNLGNRLSEAGRGEEALTATEEAVGIQRRLATDNPAAHEPDLALSLNNLGNRLSEAGRGEEALTATEEAVGIRRRLAAANPAAHDPDLALSLNRFGNRLSEVGRWEEALTATEEAVEIRRRLATDNPAAYEPDLALSLSAWASVRYEARQDMPEALRATVDAVEIYSKLVTAMPARFISPLRNVVSLQADLLRSLGHLREAEVVRAWLAANDPVRRIE